jgi:hypothetical protein
VRQNPSPDHLLQVFASRQRIKTRVDSDGTLIVPGKLAHIYRYDEHSLGVLVMPLDVRARYWSTTRRRLASLGFRVTQNGDCEGAAIFDPSNPEQAQAAIKAAGIKRKRRLSPAQINRQTSWLRASAGRAL